MTIGRVLRYLLVSISFASAALWAMFVIAARNAKQVVKEPTTMSSPANSPLQFTVKDIDGKDQNLADWKGKVLLFVNVASHCGYTSQYTELQAVYAKYKDQGFAVVGFPANNFGAQEPGSAAEIKTFCASKYSVTFPIMAKISVKGADKHPLYKLLTEAPTAGDFGGDIEWNFTKFLIDRNGNVIARFPSNVKPDDKRVTLILEKALAATEKK